MEVNDDVGLVEGEAMDVQDHEKSGVKECKQNLWNNAEWLYKGTMIRFLWGQNVQ